MSDQLDIAAEQACPHCGGKELYSRRLSSAGGQGPYLLQGLGSFLHYAHFDVIVCARCGLTRFFAEPEAREHLKTNSDWKRLSDAQG
jgi:predicted nucleic-acid-binding Zn-ribbon protein